MGQCFAIISPDQMAAVEVFGEFKHMLKPGFHFLYPWASTKKISTRLMENKVQIDAVSKDKVSVKIYIAVQQEVHPDHAQEAIYKLTNPKSQIDSFVADVVRYKVSHCTLDGLFESTDDISAAVKERLTVAMAEYGYIIRQCLVVDIVPDDKVKDAMNQINANKRLRMAAEEKAEADKIIVVKQAEAEAESTFLAGQGLARSRAAIVTGLRQAVNVPGHAELTSKDVTELLLMTQYLDSLEKMSKGKDTTIFMPHSPAVVDDVSAQLRKGIQGPV